LVTPSTLLIGHNYWKLSIHKAIIKAQDWPVWSLLVCSGANNDDVSYICPLWQSISYDGNHGRYQIAMVEIYSLLEFFLH